jgi:hypothetical protein
VTLQQQIQVQLKQQRVLVESIRKLPQFSHMAPSTSDPLQQDAEAWRSFQHVVGPDPVGDTPADDPESEEDATSVKSMLDRQNTSDEKMSNSTLGTTTKVYVDFSADVASLPEKKGDLGGLLEWDELMKRGGISGEDTGEPSIQSPKSFSGVDQLDKSSEYSVSAVSKTSNPSVSNASRNSRKSGAVESNTSRASKKTKESPPKVEEDVVSAAPLPAPTGVKPSSSPPVAPRRPVPSPAPLKERPQAAALTATSLLEPADSSTIGTKPPGRDERRWIEAAVRRMFKSLVPAALDAITEAFREWRLQPCAMIFKQGSRIVDGPGLCVLFEGVVDVLHKPLGSQENEKVCTYDRCGQCFGELELFYDAPRGAGAGRKLHWATTVSRTPVTVWVIQREHLRGQLVSASSKPTGGPALAPVESTC